MSSPEIQVQRRNSMFKMSQSRTPKSLIHLLRSRINMLEQVVWLHSIDIESSIAELRARGKISADGEALESESHPDFGEPIEPEETLSMNGSLNFECDGQARYFGSSSGRAELLQYASKACMIASPGGSFQSFDMDDIPPELVDHLVDLYFQWEQPWHQVVDETLFKQSQRDNGRFFSPLLLNCILAIGSRYSDRVDVRSDPNDPKTAGQLFLENAEVMLHFDLRSPTTATVQSLSVLAMAYVAMGSDAAAWLRHGMAFRMAFDMGFNLDPSTLMRSGQISPEEAQLRTQIYWALYCTDKFYGPRKLPPGVEMQCAFDTCLLEIKQWKYSLPPELKVNRTGKKNKFPHAYTLNMSYHTSIILLCKPFLPKNYSASPESHPQKDKVTQKAILLCAEAAKEIAALSQQYRAVFGSFRRSPVTATHCTLSAALATIQADSFGHTASRKSTTHLIETFLKTLEELSDSWVPAGRYWSSVRQMAQGPGQTGTDDMVVLPTVADLQPMHRTLEFPFNEQHMDQAILQQYLSTGWIGLPEEPGFNAGGFDLTNPHSLVSLFDQSGSEGYSMPFLFDGHT
ncbi:fungal-specific transcription factor domain-containing protein [Penicillium concentricum]|uniref:Fungal-specific transcription factor domain-containing protein n=1 Tax=Penicillium concentricum TaxID=293559 RepID=A0A9W9S8X1_9EURO|nr:fungal-specific transcription factor domain-containing protein [Penicillium concentricum]KAJ5374227.1 fungal-specific transcription factor domain-containing protein [Penicillium concentricum]